jgi:hypothetical protein
VFADCSLWAGDGFDWMLVGTREFHGGATEAQIAQQWQDPNVSHELAALGFEKPEQLGATFMADATQLRAWLGDAPELDDDHPDRLGHHLDPPGRDRFDTFAEWMDPRASRERFAASAWIARLWPAELRAHTLPYFEAQAVLDAAALAAYRAPMPMGVRVRYANQIQNETDVRTPVLWLFGITQKHLDLLDRAGGDPATDFARAIQALADRRYDDADGMLGRAREHEPFSDADIALLRSYARQMAGH